MSNALKGKRGRTQRQRGGLLTGALYLLPLLPILLAADPGRLGDYFAAAGQRLALLYLLTMGAYVAHLRITGGRPARPLRVLAMGALPLLLIAPLNLLTAAAFGLGQEQTLLLLSASLAVSYFNLGATLFAGQALDRGRRWRDGRPLLGAGKTDRGSLAGLVMAAVAGGAAFVGWPSGLLIGVCTMTGDLAASFLKRRGGLARGQRVLGLDQLDSIAVLVGLELLAGIIGLQPLTLLALAVVTLLVQLYGNVLLFAVGKKAVPW